MLPQVYDELRRVAADKLSREIPGQKLQATELVHEARLRLVPNERQKWRGSRHCFCAATEAMRRILLGLSRSAADRTWFFTRAWLFQQIRPEKF